MVSEFQFCFHSVFLRGLRGLLTFVANGATDGGRPGNDSMQPFSILFWPTCLPKWMPNPNPNRGPWAARCSRSVSIGVLLNVYVL